MSVPVIAFFNNKGGVGKTTLVYHIGWMMSELGFRVVAADLDPQGNLSAAFLDEEAMEGLWEETAQSSTIYGAVRPLQRGVGDVSAPHLERIEENLALIPGDMDLSRFEDELSQVWPKCLDRDERAFRVISAFWRVIQKGAEKHQADVVLVDLGPNLGAINRAALIASDHVVIPLGPDLYSLQGLRNLGPSLRQWRQGWQERLLKNPDRELELPKGEMRPLGYIVMAHSQRLDRPVNSYDKWIGRIPLTYRQSVLEEGGEAPPVGNDPHCLALLKHFRSLMPMAQEARKPIFHLKPADGAIGSHYSGVRDAYEDFRKLANKIIQQARISKR
ncbi:MAG: ParA family protein [Magnetococcales bacterium]|nr:ParA family protein [Magnetococcales bacterium]MBF0156532.1 ParA family protein [Magnetococcales bacterium]